MQRRDYYQPRVQKECQRTIGQKEQLAIQSIMVLHIPQSDLYMVTLPGYIQGNNEERVLLKSGLKERVVFDQCLRNNLEFERKCITNYMPSDYVDIYQEAHRLGRYDCCLTMLHGMEDHINTLAKERKELIKSNHKSYQ